MQRQKSHEFFFHVKKDEDGKPIYYLMVKDYRIWKKNNKKISFADFFKGGDNGIVNALYKEFKITRLGNFHRSKTNYTRSRYSSSARSYRIYPDMFTLKTTWYLTGETKRMIKEYDTHTFCSHHPYAKFDSDPLYGDGSMYDQANNKYPYRVNFVRFEQRKENRPGKMSTPESFSWLNVAEEDGSTRRKTNKKTSGKKPIHEILSLTKEKEPNFYLQRYVLLDLESMYSEYRGGKHDVRSISLINVTRHIYTMQDAYYKNNDKYLAMFRIFNEYMKPLNQSKDILKVELDTLQRQLRNQKFPITIEARKVVKTNCESTNIIETINKTVEDSVKEDSDIMDSIKRFYGLHMNNNNNKVFSNMDVMMKSGAPTVTVTMGDKEIKIPFQLQDIKKHGKPQRKGVKRDNEGNELQFLDVSSEEEMSEEEILYMSDLGYVSYSSESD